jgi:glycosyltransferase involved in cell wall biosynthesis
MTNIILRAPVYSQSGYGVHSKDIAISLWESQKFNISIIPTHWGGSSVSEEGMNMMEKEALFFMTNNKIHKDTPFIFVHVGLPSEFQKIGNVNIGITAGLETNKISQEWVNGCNLMNLVIVPSSIIKDTFVSSGVTTKVEVVEEGVDIDIFNEKPSNIDLLHDVSTPINLLSIGQWLPGHTGEDRKGIGLLIDTFLKTFEGDKKVGLILKTYINNNSSTDNYLLIERLRNMKMNVPYPKIHLIHGNLTNEELTSLYKHPKVKGFVSLTSGEGWGRGIAEAIACNLPVAVTGWGGHMHYMNPKYSKLVELTLKQIPTTLLYNKYFTPDMTWAYPDVQDAKRKMKDLIENPISNKNRAIEFGEMFRKTFNKKVVYSKLVSLFENLSFNLSSRKDSSIILEKF